MKTVELLCKHPFRLRPLQCGLLIFSIAFLIRLAFIFYFHTYVDPTRTELEKTAISVATKGVFGNPYAVTTGPTGHVAPGYTLILALLFRVLGTGAVGEIAKQVLSAAIASVLYGLLPSAGSCLLNDRRAGIVAALAGALYPARPIVEIKGDWETPYAAIALVLLAMMTVHLWTRHDASRRQALLQGLAWGISLLFVPALISLFLALLIAGFVFCRRGVNTTRYPVFAAIEIAVVAVCLAPWVIRNDYALGAPVLTRTNLGLELRVSNNDDATPDQRVNYLSGVFAKYHPLLSVPEALKVRAMGEIAYNKQAGDEAKRWIWEHPGRFVQLSLGRVRCYWLYYDPTSPVKTVFLGGTILLGWAGFVMLMVRRERVEAAAVIGLILLIYPLPNYLVHVGLRQEYPIHWLMMLLAAALVLRWFDRQKPARLA